MIARNLTAFICLAFAALACGDLDPEGDDSYIDEAEFGEAESALSGSSTQNVGLGWRTGDQSSCNNTSTSQQCAVPASGTGTGGKTIGYCFGSGFSESAKNSIRTGVARVDLATNWSFVETSAPCKLTYNPGVSTGGGSSSTVITAFRKFTASGTTTTLTPVAAGGVAAPVGSFLSFTTGLCGVDTADIDAAAGGLRTHEIMAHVAGNCAGLMVGAGVRSDSFPSAGASSVMDRSVTPFDQHLGMLTGEACRASGWRFSGSQTQIARTICQTSD